MNSSASSPQIVLSLFMASIEKNTASPLATLPKQSVAAIQPIRTENIKETGIRAYRTSFLSTPSVPRTEVASGITRSPVASRNVESTAVFCGMSVTLISERWRPAKVIPSYESEILPDHRVQVRKCIHLLHGRLIRSDTQQLFP